MTKKQTAEKQFADYISQLSIDGMDGRMLKLPSTTNRKREILLLYGAHASIERMQGMCEALTEYGNITLPDFPGFGGMDSFYKTGRKPTLDNLADYLASFIRMRYKKKRITILAMSFGFLVTTRMLQRNPDIASRVDIVTSIVGFVHHDAFKFSGFSYYVMRYGTTLFSQKIPAWIAQNVFLRAPLIRLAYRMVEGSNPKLSGASPEEIRERIEFEVVLWKINDIRTYMDTTITMFKADLTSERVDVPVYHVQVEDDRYFDNKLVVEHLGQIYNKVIPIDSEIAGHAPTVVASAEDAAPFIPKKIRKLLSK